jgi:hypothetical protein
MIAVAVMLGVAAGSLATLGIELAFVRDGDDSAAATRALRASLAQVNSDLTKLKSRVEASGSEVSADLARLAARVERAEEAQGEPAAKIARLSEAVERLEHPAPAVAVPPVVPLESVAAKAAVMEPGDADITGTIPQPQPRPVAASLSAPAKDASRLPVVRGWVLRNVYDGTALIQGPPGFVEVEIGDPLPGGGKVESIQRQSGRWVVVTSRGLIVAR